jgi:hypothetical protein
MGPLYITVLGLGFMMSVQGQWINHPTPGIPRTANGKPNLSAPAPKTSDGKPDLSGIWEKIADKYFNNIAADLKPGEVQPWAEALYQKRRVDFGKDSMETQCLPDGPASSTTPYLDSKIIQTPGLIAILNNDLTYRQIFMDGRELEKDPNPSWMGFSVGHWDGDTLVVESNGFTERSWLDGDGHPHTEALHMTERYHRRDFGHMDLLITLEDPKAYAHPWSVAIKMVLEADTEILEYICENEKDRPHMLSNSKVSTKVSPAILAKYAGAYQVQRYGKNQPVEITVGEDQLFYELDGQGKQPLVPYSETAFSLSGTWIEFVTDTESGVTHFLMHEVEAETKGIRRPDPQR